MPRFRRKRDESQGTLLPLPLALLHQLANLPLDDVALDETEMIEKKNAIKVVHFVTERTGEKVLPLDGDLLPVEIETFDDHDLWAEHCGSKARNTQAALIFELLSINRHDFGIHDGDQLVPLLSTARIRHQNPFRHPNLVGS